LKEEALDRIKWRNRFGRGCGPVVWQITDDLLWRRDWRRLCNGIFTGSCRILGDSSKTVPWKLVRTNIFQLNSESTTDSWLHKPIKKSLLFFVFFLWRMYYFRTNYV
jgi:hypothetical protein